MPPRRHNRFQRWTHLRYPGFLLLIITPALVLPPPGRPRATSATPDPAAPRGAVAIPMDNAPAEPWRAEWNGSLTSVNRPGR